MNLLTGLNKVRQLQLTALSWLTDMLCGCRMGVARPAVLKGEEAACGVAERGTNCAAEALIVQ